MAEFYELHGNDAAVSGAVTGASVGSAAGPWGALIGGVVGGLSSMLGRKSASALDLKTQVYQSVLARQEAEVQAANTRKMILLLAGIAGIAIVGTAVYRSRRK